MAKITTLDLEVMNLAQSNGNIFTKYYFSDFEFQDWQLLFHHAAQPAITIIGGVGSGKTVGAGGSAATYAAMLDHFKFMNVAPTSWQSSLMYADIISRAEAGRYYETFVTRVARKPYPIIELYNGSTLEFMTAQDDIVKLRSWEGDQMHLDEGGFIRTLAATLGVMRTRLRGKTPLGRPRLGRLSLTSTSTDEPDLWDRFDRMYESPEIYLSFVVRSEDNPHLSARDLMLMREEIPEEVRAIEMDGVRPMGRGVYFPLNVIMACEDAGLNDIVHRATQEYADESAAAKLGYLYEESPRTGLTLFQMPYLNGHEYLVVGDPGIGNVPHRNSSVIAVFDITGFPWTYGSKATMVAFAWISGGGRYEPFELRFKAWWEYYRCGMSAALENTGPQKSLSEYAFTLGLQGQEMWVDGMDMSGNKKNEAIQALMQLLQRGKIRFPFIRGLRNQLVSYILPDTKLAQDIVSMMITAASWLRKWRIWGYDEPVTVGEENQGPSDYDLAIEVDDPRVVRARPLTRRPTR